MESWLWKIHRNARSAVVFNLSIFDMFSQLKDTNTNAEAAQSHRSKTGGTPTMKMNIDIFPQGMHFRDNIVVSFIIMEEKDRQAKARAATVIIIGNGNTLGTSS